MLLWDISGEGAEVRNMKWYRRGEILVNHSHAIWRKITRQDSFFICLSLFANSQTRTCAHPQCSGNHLGYLVTYTPSSISTLFLFHYSSRASPVDLLVFHVLMCWKMPSDARMTYPNTLIYTWFQTISNAIATSFQVTEPYFMLAAEERWSRTFLNRNVNI